MKENITFDCKIGEFIETPLEMVEFFNEIEDVCKKYNLSIAHEDIGGAFIINSYNSDNVNWLRAGSKNY